jgi:hypothetical protein
MPVVRLVPGVYREDVFMPRTAGIRTGIAGFVGFAARGPLNTPAMLTGWSDFERQFGGPLAGGYLWYGVRGYFDNGGQVCFVVRLADSARSAMDALCGGLTSLAAVDEVDLVCAPDIMRADAPGVPPRPIGSATEAVALLQAAVLKHCDALGDRFAILDSLPETEPEQVLEQRTAIARAIANAGVPTCPPPREARPLTCTDGALYYPWLLVAKLVGAASEALFVPPCGHLAGVFARTDREVGVHKAPANSRLEGIADVQHSVTDAEQARLNPFGVNCIRALAGRGIRAWGARTLSGDVAWRYINVRRLFLTAARWIQLNTADIVFEPNSPMLWARIERDLTAYFDDLFRRGALRGATSEEAFYVHCNASTNPPDVVGQGRMVTEVGLAPALPNEFVVVRIVHGPAGVTISSPSPGG